MGKRGSTRKPDWAKWRNIPCAELWEAVALSCDIEPGSLPQYPYSSGRFETEESFLGYPKVFKLRMGIAIGNVNIHDSLRMVPGTRTGFGAYHYQVNLAKFRVWAESLPTPFLMPDEFPRAPLSATQPGRLVRPEYSTPSLQILEAAIAEFFSSNRRNPDAKRVEVVEWIKDHARKAGTHISDNVAEAIFTVIKPTDHDPKRRRRK